MKPVHPSAGKESPKDGRAAMKWLRPALPRPSRVLDEVRPYGGPALFLVARNDDFKGPPEWEMIDPEA